MTKKNKWYLVLSIIVFMLTFVAIFQNFETIHFIGFETKIIWIPIWIAVVILPLLNLYEIAINTEESNYYYWISLLINIVTILFMIRYFKLELLP
jgi:CDP-diglyceride synthetase